MARLKHLWNNGLAVLRACWFLHRVNHLGNKVRVWGKPVVNNWGNIVIGDRICIISTVSKTELMADGGTLEIGEGTYINYGCSFGATELVRIGPNCNIGTHSILIDNNYHSLEPERRNVRPDPAPIILEENVWLGGGRVIVLCGVTIGAGSVGGGG